MFVRAKHPQKGHKHLHKHDHEHYRSYTDGYNQRALYQKYKNNAALPLKGYGNDVLKYIKEHNMDTTKSPLKNRENKTKLSTAKTVQASSQLKPNIPKPSMKVTTEMMLYNEDTAPPAPSSTDYDYPDIYDPFLGYQLSEDYEYLTSWNFHQFRRMQILTFKRKFYWLKNSYLTRLSLDWIQPL